MKQLKFEYSLTVWYSPKIFPANLQEAIAEEQRMAARYANDIEIAKAQRDFELKKAAYDMEVQTKKAESDLAYELQVNKDTICTTDSPK